MARRDDLALSWDDVIWGPTAPVASMDRKRSAVVGRPYCAAVPATIATMEFDIDSAVAAGAEDARAAITRFDAELSALFDGEFAPLAAVLLRTESASSSQIENITVGAKALSLADVGLAKFGSNAKLVQANVDAMNRALEFTGPLTPDRILSVHEALMRGQSEADPGQFRVQQVWIGGTDYSPHEAEFVPGLRSRSATFARSPSGPTFRCWRSRPSRTRSSRRSIRSTMETDALAERSSTSCCVTAAQRHGPRCRCPRVCWLTRPPTTTR
jgi:hypothetical protein